jgi:hypothetical protein
MHLNPRRLVRTLSIVLITIFLAATITPLGQRGAGQPAIPTCYDDYAYLELYVGPSVAMPGTLVTLNIAYHRVVNLRSPSISIRQTW